MTNSECSDTTLTECEINDSHLVSSTCTKSRIESTSVEFSTMTGSNLENSRLSSSTSNYSRINRAEISSSTITRSAVFGNSKCTIRSCTITNGVPVPGCQITGDCIFGPAWFVEYRLLKKNCNLKKVANDHNIYHGSPRNQDAVWGLRWKSCWGRESTIFQDFSKMRSFRSGKNKDLILDWIYF